MPFKRVLRVLQGDKKKKAGKDTGQVENGLKGLIYNLLKRVP
jgi:hypothetical protein